MHVSPAKCCRLLSVCQDKREKDQEVKKEKEGVRVRVRMRMRMRTRTRISRRERIEEMEIGL